MFRSPVVAIPALSFIALALSGYAGGGRVANSPAVVPYLCEDGRRSASAIYENGSNFRLARMRLIVDGQVTELAAAPTLYGIRYRHAPSAADPRNLIWTIRGESAWLAEATDPYRPDREGQRLLDCHRQRAAAANSAGGH